MKQEIRVSDLLRLMASIDEMRQELQKLAVAVEATPGAKEKIEEAAGVKLSFNIFTAVNNHLGEYKKVMQSKLDDVTVKWP